MTNEKAKREVAPELAAMAAFALLAIVVSFYLLFHHTAIAYHAQKGPSICSLTEYFDCDAVAKSSHSVWFGVPVAGYALAFYLVVFGLSLLGRTKEIDPKRVGAVLFTLSIAAIVPSAWLLFVSFLVIDVLCPFCLLLDAVHLLFVLLSYRLLRRYGGGGGVAFAQSLRQGVCEILALFGAPFRGKEGATHTLLGFFVVVLLFAAVFQLPSVLFVHVFIPRAEREEMTALLAAWRSSPKVEIPIVNKPLEEKDYALGPPDAKVTLVEFADFECPYCKQMAPVVKDLVAELKDVRFVFRNFPLDSSCNSAVPRGIHVNACRAAKMVRCAGELSGERSDEGFWKMHETLFAMKRFKDEELSALPAAMGFESETFQGCVDSSEVEAKIAEDVMLGIKLGLNGTPAFFVNGKKLPAPNPELLKASLLEALKESNS